MGGGRLQEVVAHGSSTVFEVKILAPLWLKGEDKR